MTTATDRPKGTSPRSISGLLPFLKPYRLQIGLALLFLVMAAVSTLAFPLALRSLIDGGLVTTDKGAQVMALRNHFFALFGVAVALGLFSAARFYTVSWLGERVTADIRNAVYSHVLRQSPQFFETTQTGEVLSRLSADTTLGANRRWLVAVHGFAQFGDGNWRFGGADLDQPVGDVASAGRFGADRHAGHVLWPQSAQAVPRQPRPHCGL